MTSSLPQRKKRRLIDMAEKQMITLTIDGKTIQAQPGENVLEVALANGIDIPRMCYFPGLSISGGCRLCIVEVEGRPNPAVSCGLACEEGMAITTQSEQLYNLRRDVIDLYLSVHPLDCVTCEKAGACELQAYAYEFGISETSHNFEVSHPVLQDDNPFFVRDHQYCIMCGRCVRACDEVIGVHAIDFTERGFNSHIATPFDVPMLDSDCIFCGSCVQVCPTAALMPVRSRGKGREWEIEKTRTICEYCGVGCTLDLYTKDNKIVRVEAPVDQVPNFGYLCVKGRFGHEYIWHEDRLTTPLIRRNGELEPASWDEALDYVAERLGTIKAESGPDAIGVLTSAKCTNEENYLLQKLTRQVIGTNNLDHCARL